MMPSSSAADLREGPHLLKDDVLRSGAREELARGQALLASTEGAAGAEPKEAPDLTLKAYEAMLAGARALVWAKGYRATNIRAMVAALEALYVRPGRLDASAVEQVLAAQQVAPGTAQHLGHAKAFLARASELIGHG